MKRSKFGAAPYNLAPNFDRFIPSLQLLISLCNYCQMSKLHLRRRVGCGYFIWSQTVLCFLVSMSYIGWYRRELDYVKMGPDPDALDQSPPSASLTGFAVLVLMWLVVGFLPLAIRQLRHRKAAQGEA